MNKKIISSIILFYITLNFSLISYSYTVPVWTKNDGTTEVNADSADNFLNIESESAILIEQTTGKILFEKNSHEKLRPASITKIMTLLLVMEAIQRGELTLETPIPCSENASNMGGSQIWLNETETLTV